MSRFDARWLLIFDDGRARKEAFCDEEPPADWTLTPVRAALEARYGLAGDWRRWGHNATARVASYGRAAKEAPPA